MLFLPCDNVAKIFFECVVLYGMEIMFIYPLGLGCRGGFTLIFNHVGNDIVRHKPFTSDTIQVQKFTTDIITHKTYRTDTIQN